MKEFLNGAGKFCCRHLINSLCPFLLSPWLSYHNPPASPPPSHPTPSTSLPALFTLLWTGQGIAGSAGLWLTLRLTVVIASLLSVLWFQNMKVWKMLFSVSSFSFLSVTLCCSFFSVFVIPSLSFFLSFPFFLFLFGLPSPPPPPSTFVCFFILLFFRQLGVLLFTLFVSFFSVAFSFLLFFHFPLCLPCPLIISF